MDDKTYFLFHYPLDPFSRKVRLCLYEKGISYTLVMEEPWEKRFEFMRMNPAGEVPVLVEKGSEGEKIFSYHGAICEYLNETKAGFDLMGEDPLPRAEIRRLCGWFDTLFYMEVCQPIVGERVLKQILGKEEPDSGRIRAGRHNLNRHMKYIEWLAERRNYLGGKNLSLADFDVAAHLSVLDYLGEINWDVYPEAKGWYAKIKSRPSVQSLLTDRIAGIIPPDSYLDLDF